MVERKETGNVEEAEEGQVWGRRTMRLRREDTRLQCTQTLRLWCDQSATTDFAQYNSPHSAVCMQDQFVFIK